MSGVPLDKYLAGSPVLSSQSIEAVVSRIFEEAIAPRDAQLQQIVNQVGAKLQQLEAAIGQVALAAQQPKMTPFEVAMKAITHFNDNEPDPAAKRCWEKGVAIMERWLDAGLATSEAGGGEPGGMAQAARSEEAEVQGNDSGGGSPPPSDQEQDESAENH